MDMIIAGGFESWIVQDVSPAKLPPVEHHRIAKWQQGGPPGAPWVPIRMSGESAEPPRRRHSFRTPPKAGQSREPRKRVEVDDGRRGNSLPRAADGNVRSRSGSAFYGEVKRV